MCVVRMSHILHASLNGEVMRCRLSSVSCKQYCGNRFLTAEVKPCIRFALVLFLSLKKDKKYLHFKCCYVFESPKDSCFVFFTLFEFKPGILTMLLVIGNTVMHTSPEISPLCEKGFCLTLLGVHILSFEMKRRTLKRRTSLRKTDLHRVSVFEGQELFDKHNNECNVHLGMFHNYCLNTSNGATHNCCTVKSLCNRHVL